MWSEGLRLEQKWNCSRFDTIYSLARVNQDWTQEITLFVNILFRDSSIGYISPTQYMRKKWALRKIKKEVHEPSGVLYDAWQESHSMKMRQVCYTSLPRPRACSYTAELAEEITQTTLLPVEKTKLLLQRLQINTNFKLFWKPYILPSSIVYWLFANSDNGKLRDVRLRLDYSAFIEYITMRRARRKHNRWCLLITVAITVFF